MPVCGANDPVAEPAHSLGSTSPDVTPSDADVPLKARRKPGVRQPRAQGKKASSSSSEDVASASGLLQEPEEGAAASVLYLGPPGLSEDEGRATGFAPEAVCAEPPPSFSFDSPGLSNLRPYQMEGVENVMEHLRQGTMRQLIAMPTGAGKTITFCALARILNCRTLVLVHRDQLIDQTVAALEKMWPDASVGIVQGKRDDHSR